MKKLCIILIVFIVLLASTFGAIKIVSKEKVMDIPPIDPPSIDVEIKNPEEKFKECMKETDSSFEKTMTEELDNVIVELKKYNVSVLYNNFLDNYKIMYNEKENYYSASTVKPAAALYYYTMASKGLIDLDEQVLFAEKYWNETIRKRVPLNSMVSLRTLLKYAMTYSDNGAHKLLVERAGYETLNNFVNETVKPENIFFPNATYGHINAVDGTRLIQAVYKFIEENGELGQELKGYMTHSSLSTLKLDGIEIAQKYGWWEEVFHTIGVVYDKNPYSMVVLTKHGQNSEYFRVIDNINKKVASFHLHYMEKKTNYCKSKIGYDDIKVPF